MNTRAVMLLLPLVVSGCFTMRAELPGALRGDVLDHETEVVGDLDIEVTHPFFGAGLFGAPPPNFFAKDIERAAREKGADGVRHLSIQSTFTVSDLLVGCVGCGGFLVATRTYRIRGELVRIKKPPLPGTPLSSSTPRRQTPMPPASE